MCPSSLHGGCIDVRDGFMLAVKMSGNENIEVVIEDDQRKPDIAVQLADKMIQSEKVDVMTGIIWSNLAMAVGADLEPRIAFHRFPRIDVERGERHHLGAGLSARRAGEPGTGHRQ